MLDVQGFYHSSGELTVSVRRIITQNMDHKINPLTAEQAKAA
jgi:hypothetical protein